MHTRGEARPARRQRTQATVVGTIKNPRKLLRFGPDLQVAHIM